MNRPTDSPTTPSFEEGLAGLLTLSVLTLLHVRICMFAYTCNIVTCMCESTRMLVMLDSVGVL